MEDIKNKEDVALLVNSFYNNVKKDNTIGHIFTKVAAVNWDHHLPRMYQFWETLLFGKASFKGNPMETHITLSKKTPLEKLHFDRWLQLWQETIDANFKGEIAEKAKQKGQNIAGLMVFKIQHQ